MSFYLVSFCIENEPSKGRITYAEKGTVLKSVAEDLGYHLNTNCDNSSTCSNCRVIADGKEVPACQALVEDYEKIVIPVSSIRKDIDHTAVHTVKLYLIRFCLETELYLIRTVYAKEGTVLKTAAESLGYHFNTNCDNSSTCSNCRVIADGKEVPACQALVEDYKKIVIPVSSIRKDEDKAAVTE